MLRMNSANQAPLPRRTKYDVSSGMSVYQISMYWLNQMYAQKTLNANSSLPRSCRCESFRTPRSGPARSSQWRCRMIAARPLKNSPAKL